MPTHLKQILSTIFYEPKLRINNLLTSTVAYEVVHYSAYSKCLKCGWCKPQNYWRKSKHKMFQSKYNVYGQQFHSFRTYRVYAHGVSYDPRIINLLETGIHLLCTGNYYLYSENVMRIWIILLCVTRLKFESTLRHTSGTMKDTGKLSVTFI